MNDKELLAALGRLKVETGSLACMGCGHEHDCGIHGCAILREMIAWLERTLAEGMTDAEIAEKLGIPVERLVGWRQRVGLLRPRVPPQCRQDTGENERPAEAGRTQEEQTMKKQSMDVRTPSAAEAGIVTVKTLRALLDAAEASGYGDAPLEVKGCRFAEMHLRVETLIGADVPGTLVELMATPAET